MAIQWKTNAGDLLTAQVGPFSLKVQPQGDGRWAWEIHSGDTPNPAATGIARSLGAAKNVTEQFVKGVDATEGPPIVAVTNSVIGVRVSDCLCDLGMHSCFVVAAEGP